MSVNILIVDDEPDVAELFRQQFRRETRQGTYVCITPLRGRRHWIGSQVRSSPHWSRSCQTSTCPAWTLQLLGEIKRRLPDLPVMIVTAYGDDE
jgi:DNA-binding NtrC family response regulator